jgi:penicillin-binding protein 1A
MKKVTGGTLPARLWHDIMLYAHRDKAPAPLPGTHAPWFNDAIARLPWNAPEQAESDDAPLYQRVLGIFAGQ